MEKRANRRVWDRYEKRQIVEETLKPRASVSVVARAHDVNANQVFRWRQLYRQGRLEIESEGKLLPVRIADLDVQKACAASSQKPKVRRNGIIDIDLGHARVRIEGAADPECVRAAVEGLLR